MEILFTKHSITVASAIALVGQDFNGTLDEGEIAYFEYGLPEEGLTVKVEAIQGIITIYVSTIISNPNEALHDFKLVTSTTVCVFVPPKTPPNERKRRVTDPSANDVVKVYIAIEGQSSLNHFTLNTTKDDTTPPGL